MIQDAQQKLNRLSLTDMLKTVILSLVIFGILSVLFGRFEIHQVSMEPNFHEGQRVLVSKLDHIWSTVFVRTAHAAETRQNTLFALQRGQVVVFSKTSAPQSETLIKRVIGLPGDTLDLSNGAVFINGIVLNEPYLQDTRTDCVNYCQPFTLGPDEYFLMGDNRSNSLDSRSFGTISANQIIGQVIARYWPLTQATLYP